MPKPSGPDQRPLKRVVAYLDIVDVPGDLEDGERVVFIRGDGPREGDVMCSATARKAGGGWDFRIGEEQ